jgi:hypothetical protein
MRRTISILCATLAVGVFGAACSNGTASPPTTVPSLTLPSGLPTAASSLASAAVTAFCGHFDELRTTLDELEATPGTVPSDVSTRLSELSSSLSDDATALESEGQTAMAQVARTAATAVGALGTLIAASPGVAEALQTAVGSVNDALDQLPADACASATST